MSLDIAQEAIASDKQMPSANMLDFLVKEEPLGEDDLKAMQKDRQKKDNHNMSKFNKNIIVQANFRELQLVIFEFESVLADLVFFS